MRTKRAFEVKEKSFFIIFKELSVAKNCLRPESASLQLPIGKLTKNELFIVHFYRYWPQSYLALLKHLFYRMQSILQNVVASFEFIKCNTKYCLFVCMCMCFFKAPFTLVYILICYILLVIKEIYKLPYLHIETPKFAWAFSKNWIGLFKILKRKFV